MDEGVFKFKVYAKIAKNGIVTAINSSAFLRDTSEWTEIDEGFGDKYQHAQNNYLPEGLIDKNGLYNYKLTDGKLIERTDEDKAPEMTRSAAEIEILQLKQNLADTDYIAAKISEGAATRQDYEVQVMKRAEWRARINELESII